MNARTKELADQVMKDAKGGLNFEQFYEKFARLIVRECIDIISPYAIRMENFDGGHPITDLKRHFGV